MWPVLNKYESVSASMSEKERSIGIQKLFLKEILNMHVFWSYWDQESLSN